MLVVVEGHRSYSWSCGALGTCPRHDLLKICNILPPNNNNNNSSSSSSSSFNREGPWWWLEGSEGTETTNVPSPLKRDRQSPKKQQEQLKEVCSRVHRSRQKKSQRKNSPPAQINSNNISKKNKKSSSSNPSQRWKKCRHFVPHL